MLARLLVDGRVELVVGLGSASEYLFVNDFALAAARVALAELPPFALRLFNVGTGRVVGPMELRLALPQVFPEARVTLRRVPPKFDAIPGPLPIDRIAALIGWTPCYDLAGGLAMMRTTAVGS